MDDISSVGVVAAANYKQHKESNYDTTANKTAWEFNSMA